MSFFKSTSHSKSNAISSILYRDPHIRDKFQMNKNKGIAGVLKFIIRLPSETIRTDVQNNFMYPNNK